MKTAIQQITGIDDLKMDEVCFYYLPEKQVKKPSSP